MKKALVISVTEKELQELYRILLDRDKDGALEFLDTYARAPLHQAMLARYISAYGNHKC
ncbi:MAG: hypothetical protein AB1817_13500 [Chloroflexota bacterium]